jgi:hypothetical protein
MPLLLVALPLSVLKPLAVPVVVKPLLLPLFVPPVLAVPLLVPPVPPSSCPWPNPLPCAELPHPVDELTTMTTAAPNTAPTTDH